MRRSVSVLLFCVMLLSLVLSPAQARDGRPALPAADVAAAAGMPPAAAQAGLSPAAWGRIVEQIRADQAQSAASECAAAGYSQEKKLTASDGAAWNQAGWSVAIWGDAVVVGVFGATVGGNANQGAAYLFARNAGGADNWGQVTRLTASDGAAYDVFGWSVAIWGDAVVVGALRADVGGNSDQGAAYLFARNAGGTDNWGEVKKLTASDGTAEDQFGFSVAIWGDAVVVGAVLGDGGGSTLQGAAYLFARNAGGADIWGQVTKLTASDGAKSDWFGYSVAIWGDAVVVGAPYADINGKGNQGAAYLFARNAGGVADSWGEVIKLTASDGAAGNYFGHSVAIWDDAIVVGTYGADVADNIMQGAAYLFARNAGGADSWGQVTRLTAADGAANDYFGFSVAIWGDAVVVGAPYANIGGYPGQGAAYVFARNAGGADNWGEVNRLTASDGAAWDYFGWSVAIWSDAALVGAYRATVGDNFEQGAAYLFARNAGGAEMWGQVKKLSPSDDASFEQFGWSVAIWSDAVVVGASAGDIGGITDQGAAYLFARNAGGADNWGQVTKLTASDGAASDQFGSSVAIWGDALAVGAPYADIGGNANQGAAYLFGCAAVGADVQISKSAEPPLVSAGGTLTYTLTYASNGPGPASEVWISDTLPAGAIFGGQVSGPPGWTGPNHTAGVVSWYTPTLDAGASGTFVITASLSSVTAISPDWVLTNTATISATADITPTNNLFQATSVVQGLQMVKSHFPQTVTAAWNFWFTIDVTNTATSPATNLVIRDTLPPQVAPYSVQPDLGGVFDGVNIVTWTIPTLGPNSTIRLSIQARTYSNSAGTCMTNQVWADSDQAAPPVTASDVACIVAGPPPQPTSTPTCPDPYEPNDSLATAWPLTPGAYWSYLCCTTPADQDYFRVTLQAGDELQATLSELPFNYDLCLYAPSGAQLACSTNPLTATEVITHLALEDGDHVLRVYGWDGKVCISSLPYKLTVAVTAAAAVDEPTPTPTLTPTGEATVTPTRTATATATATATVTATPAVYRVYVPLTDRNNRP